MLIENMIIRLEKALNDITSSYNSAADILNEAIKELKLHANIDTDAGAISWKREDGRLNDNGISISDAMFSSGATVTDVAKHLKITISAASNRRKIWLAKG